MKIMDVEMFGGPGKAHFEHVLTADEMHGMNRVYARVTLKPGCAVGYHVIREMEKIILFFLVRQP